MNKKVAITGGIGSGKTFVCQIFKTLGVPVYYADEKAKYLMNNNANVINEIKMLFGADIYNPDLDRKRLSSIVFNNKDMLDALNNIVHPAVRLDFMVWANAQNTSYVIEESAIIFESNHADMFDKIITVTADEEIRIERAMKRDGTDRKTVLDRINNQISDTYKANHSDFVIINNENDIEASFLNLIPQIFAIHTKLKSDIYKDDTK